MPVQVPHVRVPDHALTDDAVERAGRILASSAPTRAEQARSRRLARLLSDDDGRDLLLGLTDQVIRIRDPRRSARMLSELTRCGVPHSLGRVDRLGLRFLGLVAPAFPRTAQRLVSWRVGHDTAGVILPADDPAFAHYVAGRRRDGFRLNVNVLGEAILGDDEADARTRAVERLIGRPDVDYVSVKISAVCANLDVLAWEDSLGRIDTQLTRLYRAAARTSPRTFVNLDMEEYRDLGLSVAAFMRVLGRAEFAHLPAGIVLQAYVPDSHAALEELCGWANARHASGGAPIKIRIVKGANLANEQVEAEAHGWPLATYGTKADVDASYKRLIDRALEAAEPGAVRLGIASHNLLEIGWALALRDRLADPERIEIEMLEGMAPPQSRAVQDAAGEVLLYAPVVAAADREASIAYLSRRLDENAAPENFLHALLDLAPDSAAWVGQVERFRHAVAARHRVSTTSNRTAAVPLNRSVPALPWPGDGSFSNTPDTDFTIAGNREWIAAAFASSSVPQPTVVDDPAIVDGLIGRGLAAQRDWSSTSWAHRRTVLSRAADALEAMRGPAIAVMARTTGKTAREGDTEVSEAVDFARYAAHLTLAHERFDDRGLTWGPHRLTVVAGPWNFPFAIPTSGLVHSVAAGGAAILKPAPQAREIATLLVGALEQAGLPAGLVQVACTPDDEVGRHLITHPDVDLVLLTGSFETAEMFTRWRPSMRLLAETSGKNAIIVTQAADRDLAIKDLVRSAFGHAGQKCSAASLAIVEGAVYDDPIFLARLADAVRSIAVGPADDPASMMGPLIEPPTGKLERALTELEPGESWLVRPACLDAARGLWSPGVRLGVRPGSWFHRTECFGPVLGVMRAADLDEAIGWQNGVDYGLTGGISSLDPAEIDRWLERVEVGNAYVNRHITGAIVRRQPFGGWKRSSIGGGGKPGGPGHLHSYGTWTGQVRDEVPLAERFSRAWADHFAQEHDPSGLASEVNVLRYRAVDQVILRVADPEDPQVAVARAAAAVSGAALVVSAVAQESDDDLAARVSPPVDGVVRLRLLTEASDRVHLTALAAGIAIDRSPVVDEPMIELRRWTVEQAIARTMHRHGRVLRRERQPVPPR